MSRLRAQGGSLRSHENELFDTAATSRSSAFRITQAAVKAKLTLIARPPVLQRLGAEPAQDPGPRRAGESLRGQSGHRSSRRTSARDKRRSRARGSSTSGTLEDASWRLALDRSVRAGGRSASLPSPRGKAGYSLPAAEPRPVAKARTQECPREAVQTARHRGTRGQAKFSSIESAAGLWRQRGSAVGRLPDFRWRSAPRSTRRGVRSRLVSAVGKQPCCLVSSASFRALVEVRDIGVAVPRITSWPKSRPDREIYGEIWSEDRHSEFLVSDLFGVEREWTRSFARRKR